MNVDVEVNVDEGVVAHSVDRPSGKLVAGTHRHTHRSTLTHTQLVVAAGWPKGQLLLAATTNNRNSNDNNNSR